MSCSCRVAALVWMDFRFLARHRGPIGGLVQRLGGGDRSLVHRPLRRQAVVSWFTAQSLSRSGLHSNFPHFKQQTRGRHEKVSGRIASRSCRLGEVTQNDPCSVIGSCPVQCSPTGLEEAQAMDSLSATHPLRASASGKERQSSRLGAACRGSGLPSRATVQPPLLQDSTAQRLNGDCKGTIQGDCSTATAQRNYSTTCSTQLLNGDCSTGLGNDSGSTAIAEWLLINHHSAFQSVFMRPATSAGQV